MPRGSPTIDRATLLAKQKMDELLIDRAAPRNQDFAADFDPAITGGVRSGWHARVTPFEATPGASGSIWDLDRVELEIWWMSGQTRRSLCARRFSPQHPADKGTGDSNAHRVHSASQRGVTLLELMIAITLVAGLSTGMLMAMRTSLLTYEKTAKKLESNRRFVKTQQILSNQIAAVIPAQGLCAPGAKARPSAMPSFLSGSADALRLVTSYSIAEGARGYPQIVEYRVIPERTRQRAAGGDGAPVHGPAEHHCVSAAVHRRPAELRMCSRTIWRTAISLITSLTIKTLFSKLPGCRCGTNRRCRRECASKCALWRPEPAGFPCSNVTVPIQVTRDPRSMYDDGF